jgi:hypothetical protein
MPNYAYVEADIKCPFCDKSLTDTVAFQWGYCPGSLPRMGHIYHIGDAISWKLCKDGTIPAWVYFDFGDEGANIGDPSYKNLVVRDSLHEGLAMPCRFCMHELGGAISEITEGRITSVRILCPGELDQATDFYLVQENGLLTPKLEWDDHAMDVLNDC